MLHFPRSLNPIIAMVNLDSNYDNAYANYEVQIKHINCECFFFIFCGIDMFSFNFSQNWFLCPDVEMEKGTYMPILRKRLNNALLH